MRPTSARRPVWVTLPSHAALPAAERPAFLVKPMSFGEMTEWHAETHDGDAHARLVDDRLRGWRGIVTEDGSPIAFSAGSAEPAEGASTWRRELTRTEAAELYEIVLAGSRVAPTDRGNSSTPSG